MMVTPTVMLSNVMMKGVSDDHNDTPECDNEDTPESEKVASRMQQLPQQVPFIRFTSHHVFIF